MLHRCDNRACYSLDHLFLGTQQDNLRDMTAKGRRTSRSPAGELQPTSKLTLAQVERIRSDARPAKEIAGEFGIAQGYVYAIRNGRAWKYGNGYVSNGALVP